MNAEALAMVEAGATRIGTQRRRFDHRLAQQVKDTNFKGEAYVEVKQEWIDTAIEALDKSLRSIFPFSCRRMFSD